MNDRYYSVALMEIFTNNFACLSQRTTGSRAMTFAIAGSEWDDTVPSGTCLVRSPCNDVWLLGRILVDQKGDLPQVHVLQDAM